MQHINELRLANFISAVLNPPIVAAYTFAMLVVSEGPGNGATVLFVSIFFATLVPIATLYVLAKKKIIPDVQASKRETRFVPFLTAIVSYTLGTLGLLLLRASLPIIAVMLCYLVNTTIMTLITLRWKISIHTSGIAGPATVLMYLLGFVGYLFLLLVIPVTWARMTLKAHTGRQLLAGILLTIVITYIQLRIYLAVL